MVGFNSRIQSHPPQSNAPFRDPSTHWCSSGLLSITQLMVDHQSGQGFSAFLVFRALPGQAGMAVSCFPGRSNIRAAEWCQVNSAHAEH